MFISYFNEYGFCILLEKSQDLLQQKDTIVNKLVDALEELLSKSLIEIDFNNTELLKLSEVAKSKLNVLKEEHKNQNVFMNVSTLIIVTFT